MLTHKMSCVKVDPVHSDAFSTFFKVKLVELELRK